MKWFIFVLFFLIFPHSKVLQHVHSQENNANRSEDASNYEQPSTRDSCKVPTLVDKNPTPTVGVWNYEHSSNNNTYEGPTLVGNNPTDDF